MDPFRPLLACLLLICMAGCAVTSVNPAVQTGRAQSVEENAAGRSGRRVRVTITAAGGTVATSTPTTNQQEPSQ